MKDKTREYIYKRIKPHVKVLVAAVSLIKKCSNHEPLRTTLVSNYLFRVGKVLTYVNTDYYKLYLPTSIPLHLP